MSVFWVRVETVATIVMYSGFAFYLFKFIRKVSLAADKILKHYPAEIKAKEVRIIASENTVIKHCFFRGLDEPIKIKAKQSKKKTGGKKCI